MANEKRLIDANALDAQFRETKMIELFPHWKELSSETKSELIRFGKALKEKMQNAPTVDAVEVPCKVGSLVWGIKRFNRGQKAIQSVVTQMYFGDNMRLGIVVKGVCHGEWGKNVFATEEEALAKIDGERKDNE